MVIRSLVSQWFGFWRRETHHWFCHSVLCQGWQGFALREQGVSYRAFFPKKSHSCRLFIINSLFLRNELFSFCSNTLFYFLFPLGPVLLFQYSSFSANVNMKTGAFPVYDRSDSHASSASSWKLNQWASPDVFAMKALMEERKQTSWTLTGAWKANTSREITRKMTLLQDTNWFMVSQRRKNWHEPCIRLNHSELGAMKFKSGWDIKTERKTGQS